MQAQGGVLPRFFAVNWFQTDDEGRFVWPGFGENMRVLKWMLDRIEDRVPGQETPLGRTPRFQELCWDGLDFEPARFERLTRVDSRAWRDELAEHQAFFDRLGPRLPAPLRSRWAQLSADLG